jgi:ribosomal protein S18 acetylase RimI-like enzyme
MSVLQDYQSQGIGGQLLNACEYEASERGVPQIGLGVDHSNPRARLLYLRYGYEMTELDNCIDRYQRCLDSGELVWIEEPGSWLVKPLI